VDISVRRKQVVHDDEMDLASIGYLYAMQTVELGKKRVGIILYVVVVIFQYLPEKLVFGVVDSLDDVLVVSGEIEKAATLAG
jgi:hypothetical protein